MASVLSKVKLVAVPDRKMVAVPDSKKGSTVTEVSPENYENNGDNKMAELKS
jgi:hypothetical protein